MYSVVLMMALSGGTEAVDFGHRNGCSCAGSYGCSGAVGYGCYGGYGCSGGAACCGTRRLFGHRSGGCYGGGCYGGVSYGGCSGGGCYGGGCYGGGCYGGGVIVSPGMGAPYGEPLKVLPKVDKKPQDEVRGPAPATILVTLPAAARLTIDGAPTTSTTSTRALVTPALDPDNTYVYTLRAEVNGQTQAQEVRVRAGQTSTAQFNFPVATVAGR
jgi:uncharacterized protein (TIGR03000 family)